MRFKIVGGLGGRAALAGAAALAAALMSGVAGGCAGGAGGGGAASRPARPAPGRTLELVYRVSRVDGDPGALRLRLELPAGTDAVRELQLPEDWAGRRELWRNVHDLRAVTPGARVAEGAGPARRRLDAPPGAPVAVEWTLRPARGDAAATDARGAHNHTDLGPRWAQLVGHDALVLPALRLGTPVRATFIFEGLPRGAVLATSFGVATGPEARVVHRGVLGELQHAVYTAGFEPGAVRLSSMRAGTGTVHLAVRGRLAIPDGTLADAVRRVVAAERGFWRDRGPPTYLVSVGVAPRGTLAGTRLTGSFIANIDSTRRMDEVVVTLFGHELMHDWIGGAIGPDPNLPEGALSWFTEGFTDFASQRVLWRTKLLSDSAYLASVNDALREHAMSPARDLPWSEVVARRWTDEAAQRQPYLRGRLLALRLDAAMRAASSGRRSLDDVLRGLLDAALEDPPPLTESTLVEAFARELDPEVARREVRLALAGGRLELPAAMFGPCATARVTPRGSWDPGFDVDASIAERRARGVRAGGAAAAAGLREGMTIAGISLWRGDATRPVHLTVRDEEGERRISFLPESSAKVEVQEFSLGRGCRVEG